MTEDKKLAIECVLMLCMLAGNYSLKGEEEAQINACKVLTELGVDVEDIAEAMKDLNENGYDGNL
jgi:pimeloyl-CoA synthetase